MKPLTYALVALSLLWLDVAYRGVTQKQEIVVIRKPVYALPSSYVLPVSECSRVCRAKWKSAQIGGNK